MFLLFLDPLLWWNRGFGLFDKRCKVHLHRHRLRGEEEWNVAYRSGVLILFGCFMNAIPRHIKELEFWKGSGDLIINPGGGSEDLSFTILPNQLDNLGAVALFLSLDHFPEIKYRPRKEIATVGLWVNMSHKKLSHTKFHKRVHIYLFRPRFACEPWHWDGPLIIYVICISSYVCDMCAFEYVST